MNKQWERLCRKHLSLFFIITLQAELTNWPIPVLVPHTVWVQSYFFLFNWKSLTLFFKNIFYTDYLKSTFLFQEILLSSKCKGNYIQLIGNQSKLDQHHLSSSFQSLILAPSGCLLNCKETRRHGAISRLTQNRLISKLPTVIVEFPSVHHVALICHWNVSVKVNLSHCRIRYLWHAVLLCTFCPVSAGKAL